MRDNYESFMYLAPDDLDAVENKIEELTNLIQENIYDGQQSPLRNIQVGDDLSGKTLYLSFPRNSYNYINNTVEQNIITIDNNFYIGSVNLADRGYKVIRVHYTGTNPFIYSKDENVEGVTNPYLNYVRFKLPDDYGIVTEINQNNDFYQYIKIYENEEIIPDYVTKTWVSNEIPFMQDIDKIEEGVKNLGKYFTKPIGWITTRTWFNTNTVTDRSDYCAGSKGFSYQDINRWIHNLNLIEQEDMGDFTIWNTDKTEYEWEGHSEWSDYKVQYEGDDVQYGGSDIYYEYVD